MLIYIVIGSWIDPYEGGDQWIVDAYTTSKDAFEHVVHAANWVIAQSKGSTPDNKMNPYDPMSEACDWNPEKLCYYSIEIDLKTEFIIPTNIPMELNPETI